MIVGYKRVPVDNGDEESTQECTIVSENESLESAEASMTDTQSTYASDDDVQSYFYAFRTSDTEYEVFAVIDK
tara:strand:- start:1453 stop:1671 length:219 start_codon:yes stop_codon:yes gene_type:complete